MPNGTHSPGDGAHRSAEVRAGVMVGIIEQLAIISQTQIVERSTANGERKWPTTPLRQLAVSLYGTINNPGAR